MTTKDVAPSVWQRRRLRIAQQTAERTRRKQERQQPAPIEDDEEKEERPARRRGKKTRRGSTAATSARSTKPRIGFLRASHIERAFILAIYGGVLLLIALSIIGTFYGSQGANAPITKPGLIWATMLGSGSRLYWAIGGQVALSLTQYGARQMARHDWRWWLLYLAALGISVYFNIQAYATPLLAFMLPIYAYALIVAFDVLPEFVSIRHD